MEKVYVLVKSEISDRFLAVLESLKLLWPGEITVVDSLEVKCTSERAKTVVGTFIEGELKLEELPSENIQGEAKQIDSPQFETTELQAQPLCLVCKEPFEPKTAKSKFCSKNCAAKYYDTRYKAKKNQMSGVTIVYDQERETDRIMTGINTGKMALKGRKL